MHPLLCCHQRDARKYIETLHQREDNALKEVIDEFDKWAKAEEQKERVKVTEIKQSLLNLGATEEDEKPLSDFAASLEKPLIGKDGKTYVAVPRPDRLIPLLKKVVQKMLGAFGWSHGMQKKTQEHVEHTRVSFKVKLPQKKQESDRLSEERRAAERQVTMNQTEHMQGQPGQKQGRKRDETTL